MTKMMIQAPLALFLAFSVIESAWANDAEVLLNSVKVENALVSEITNIIESEGAWEDLPSMGRSLNVRYAGREMSEIHFAAFLSIANADSVVIRRKGSEVEVVISNNYTFEDYTSTSSTTIAFVLDERDIVKRVRVLVSDR